MWAAHKLLLVSFVVCTSAADSLLTPSQVQHLADVRVAAASASEKAEQELLATFSSPMFRLGLVRNGAYGLALMPSTELMAKFKGALNMVEYVSNFGVDPAYRKAHPGEPSMGFDTIQKYGYIPNMWELRARNSPLVKGTPEIQWEIMEAAERGLYQLPLQSKPLPIGPNVTEALERPQYLGGNLRRIDVGLARYGSYAAVVRNDVVRQRASILPSDSGGWENICNNSVTPIHKWFRMMRYVAPCDGINKGGEGRVVPGTADHQLHTILGSTTLFGTLGGDISRLVYQVLTPGATARPFETLLYTEAGLLGPLRPQDMKMIVASFPGIFGTSQAIILQAFCAQHKIPLVWAINGGETWSESTFLHSKKWLPLLAPSDVPVGPDRLLDPTAALVTNATLHLPSLKQVWSAVTTEIVRRRANKGNLAASEFNKWWNQLSALGGGLQTLRHGDCESSDSCLGTHSSLKKTQDCVCMHSTSGNADSEAEVLEWLREALEPASAIDTDTPSDETHASESGSQSQPEQFTEAVVV